MPVPFISTRTSPDFGPSRSSSTISSGFFASNATAARVFICHISLEDLAWARVSYFSSSPSKWNFSLTPYLGVSGLPEMAQHPSSLLQEHCTLTPNVKAHDFRFRFFCDALSRIDKYLHETGSVSFAAANKMCCIAARYLNELFHSW